jgi:hypothetical protein
MYSREGAARPLEVRKGSLSGRALGNRDAGPGPGAGGIADIPHVQFSVTDAYDAGIRRIETQSHRGVDLRHARLETSSSEAHKRHRHRRKDLLPDSSPTAGASIGRHGSAAMSRPPMMSPTITHFQSAGGFCPGPLPPLLTETG